VPAAIILTKLRAAIVSAVAPHTPLESLSLPGFILHGPMEHILQHNPSRPNLHPGDWFSDLSQLSSALSFLAFSIKGDLGLVSVFIFSSICMYLPLKI
jgi:hypothetical protein